MTLEITLLTQAALSVVSGTATVAGMVWHGNTKKGFRLIPLWTFYTFYIFLGMAVIRVLLLYDGIVAYGENMYLLFLDAMTAVCSAVFLVKTARQQTRVCICMKIVVCAVLAIVNGLQFMVLAGRYANANAALYGVLEPGSFVIKGLLITGVGYFMPNVILGSDRCKKYSMPVAVSMLCAVTLYLSPAFETMITNANELMFAIEDVWYIFAVFGMAVFVAVLAVLLLVSERRSRIICVVLWMGCISAYLQGMFLNGSLFLMDGKKLDWSSRLKITNMLLWCVCLAGLTALCRFVGGASQKLIMYSSFMLCVMQAAGVMSLIPAYQKDAARRNVQYENYLSMEGICEVASEENVIIFVLDTYDVDFLEQVLDRQSDFLEPLKGFTYYPDNVSQFSRTFPSIPYMLTEEMYFYEEPLADYVDRAFSECIFWEGLRQEGYQCYLFEEEEEVIGSTVLKTAANFVTRGEVLAEEYSFPGCVQTAVKIGSYRLMPYAFKNCFTYTSADINEMVISRRILDRPMYSEEDAYLWKQLKEIGLSVGNDRKAFRFIHTKGAHAPYTMNEKGERVHEETNAPERMYEGSMRFVFDYLEQLQRMGVYKQSMIIITADHGENFVTEELTQETNPILFIKPCGIDADIPLQVSDTMASQNDLLPTISAAIGIGYDDSWGLDLLKSGGKDKTRTRYHYYAVVENTIQTKTRRYNIDGNSRDFANWTATDEYHEFGGFY